MSTYQDRLKDPRWQRKRLEVFERFNFQCANCKDSASTLHAHHRYYIQGREPWDYPDVALVCLCDECHQICHENSKIETDCWEEIIGMISNNDPWVLVDIYKILAPLLQNGVSKEALKNHVITSISQELLTPMANIGME